MNAIKLIEVFLPSFFLSTKYLCSMLQSQPGGRISGGNPTLRKDILRAMDVGSTSKLHISLL